MSDDNQPPDWWDQVIDPPLNSKADARRVVKLCMEGEFKDAWKPQWKAFATREGYIRLEDFERAKAILMGAIDPDPGRPKRHDWDLLKSLVLEVAAAISKPVNKAAVRRQVANLYRDRHELVINPESGSFKRKVRDWLGE